MTDLEERWAHEDEIQSYRIALAERGRTIRGLQEQLAEREAEIRCLRERLRQLRADVLDTAEGVLSGAEERAHAGEHGGER